MTALDYRIGLDLGGTKIAGIIFDRDDRVLDSQRRPTPRGDYAATLQALAAMVRELSARHAGNYSVGVGIPGSLRPGADTVQNANSTWLNGQSVGADFEQLLGQPVRCENDANCFALSEAHDGAAQGKRSVFGVILGTGCGGGLVFDGRLVSGPRNIGGEWGHNPLPWPEAGETPGPSCWCGLNGCLETWISGTGLADDHLRVTQTPVSGENIVQAAQAGHAAAKATLDRHASRLARGLAHVVNIFDPDVIVLGGGLSSLQHLYVELPALMSRYIFAADRTVDIRPPKWGDASGVRGAARLWPLH